MISQGSGGFLSASNKFPDNPKAKGIFFIKHNLTEAINADCSNFRSNVYMGELNPAAIENFSALVEEVHVQTESGIYYIFYFYCIYACNFRLYPQFLKMRRITSDGRQ